MQPCGRRLRGDGLGDTNSALGSEVSAEELLYETETVVGVVSEAGVISSHVWPSSAA